MKNLTTTPKLTPLSIDHLNSIIGGDGGQVNITDLLADASVIVEDFSQI